MFLNIQTFTTLSEDMGTLNNYKVYKVSMHTVTQNFQKRNIMQNVTYIKVWPNICIKHFKPKPTSICHTIN